MAAWLLALWVVPPLSFIAVAFGIGGAGLVRWAAAASTAGLFFWIVVRARYRAHPLFALLYPIGAATIALLLLRSAWRGGNFSWKGRLYDSRLSRAEPVRRT